MQIDSLSDLFALSLNGLSLDQSTITTDGANVVIHGKATVMGAPGQDVTITLRSQDGKIVPAIDVGFPAMSLRQMSQAGWLPPSMYTAADLPDVTFGSLKVTPQSDARVVVLGGSATTTTVTLGIASLPLSPATIQLSLAVPESGPVQNIDALIGGTLAIGAGLPVQVTLPRGSSDWQLIAGAADPVALSNGLDDLTSLAEQRLTPILPSSLVSLAGIGLTAVAAQFNTRDSTISSLQIGIGTTTPWPIIPNPDPNKPAILEISRINVALRIVAYALGDGTRATSVSGAILGVLSILDVEVQVRIPIPPLAGGWVLTCYPNLSIPGIGSLATSLSNLVGAGDPSSAYPPGFDDLGNFTINALEVVFTPSPPTLTSVAFQIASGAPWTLPYIPDLQVSDILVDLLIDYPADSARRAVSGSFAGKVLLGQMAYIPVQIQRLAGATNWSLAVLYDDLDVGLPDLLRLAGVDAASFRAALPSSLSIVSDLRLTSLGLVYDLTAKQLQNVGFTIDLSDPWTIFDGLTVDELEASLYVEKPGQADQSSSANISTRVEIAEVAFLFGGTKAPRSPWLISAGLAPGEILSLNSVIDWVLAKLQVGVQLPASFPQVTASAALLEITPDSGAFYASLTSTVTWALPFAKTTFTINSLQPALDVGPKPAAPATGDRPYTFTVSGAFVCGPILGAASFSTGNTGVDTILQVAVSSSPQAISLPGLAKELTSGSQTGAESWKSLLPGMADSVSSFAASRLSMTAARPAGGDSTHPFTLAILANFSQDLFLLYGQAAGFGTVAFLAKKLDGSSWGYLAAAKLADDFTFATISADLAPVDSVLKIRKAGFSIVSADLPSVQGLVKDQPEFANAISLSSTNQPAPLKAGANIYGELEFTTPLLTNTQTVLFPDPNRKPPAITLYAFIASAPGQSLFQASLENVTLSSALAFNTILLQYRPRDPNDPNSEDQLDLLGDMVVTVDSNSYTFHEALRITDSKATFSLSTTQELPSPLGMFHVTLKQLALTVEYQFGAGAGLEISLAATVGFGKADLNGQQPVVLDGKLLFVGGAPQIVEIALSKSLSIDDFMTTVLPENIWPTGWLKITFVSGRIYYALTDGTFFGLQYRRGFQVETQIDVWDYSFTVKAHVEEGGLTISGSANRVIDLYVAQLSDTAFAPNTSPELTISTLAPNSSFGFAAGVTLFQSQVGTASLAYVPGASRFEGSFTYNGTILDTKNPSISFAWSQSRGFELVGWNLSLFNDAYDYGQKISELSAQFSSGSGCGKLVGMAFDKAITNTFSVSIGAADPSLPLAEDKSSYTIPLQVTVAVAITGQNPFLTRSFPTPLVIKAPGEVSWSHVLEALGDTVLNSLEAIIKEILLHPDQFAAFIAAVGLKKLASTTVSSLLCRNVKNSQVQEQAEASTEEEASAAEEAAGTAEEAATAAEGTSDLAGAAASATAAEGAAGTAAGAAGVLAGLVGGLLALFGISKSSEQQRAEKAKQRAEEAAERARQAVLKRLTMSGLSISSPAEDTIQVGWNPISGDGVTYDLVLEQGGASLASPTDLSDHSFRYTSAQQIQPGLSYGVKVRAVLRAHGKTFEGAWQSAALGIPTIPAPTSLAVEQVEQQLVLSWAAGSPDTVGYEAQAQDAQGQALAPQPAISLSGTSATISGLTVGMTYIFAVRGLSNTARSVWVRSAPTAVSALAAPQQLSLSFSLAGAQPTIQAHWQDTQTGVDYQIQLRDSGGRPLNPQPTVTRDGLTAICSGAPLQLGQTYQLRVAVTRGGERVWSQPAPIALLAQPQPSIASLAYDTARDRVVVTFAPVTGVGSGKTSYEAQLLAGTPGRAFGAIQPVPDDPTKPSLMVELDPTGVPAGAVQAQLRTISDSPDVAPSAWAISTTTLTALGAPTAPTTTYDSARNQLRADWGSLAGSQRYEAQLVANGQPFGAATPVSTGDPAPPAVEQFLDLPAELPAGTVQVRVRAVAAAPQQISGAWVTSAQPLIRLQAPTISALEYEPSSSDQPEQLTVTCQSVPNGVGYRFAFLFAQGEPDPKLQVEQTLADPAQTSLRVSMTLDDTPPPGILRVRAMSLNPAPGYLPSSWASSTESLTRLAAPQVSEVSEDSGALVVTLAQPITGASLYQGQLLDQANGPQGSPGQSDGLRLEIATANLPDGSYGLRTRAIGVRNSLISSAWQRAAQQVQLARRTPETLARELRAQGKTAQGAAAPIHTAFPALDATTLTRLLQAVFPESARTLAQLAWALNLAGYSQDDAGRALGTVQPSAPLPELAAALHAGYPAQELIDYAAGLQGAGLSAQAAAGAISDSEPGMSAVQLGILISTACPATAATPLQLAQALRNAGYPTDQAADAIGQIFPLAPLAETAAAIRQSYQPSDATQLAAELRGQGLSAAQAAPLIKGRFAGLGAGELLGLLRSGFPDQAGSPTAMAWALQQAGYSQQEAGAALGAAYPGESLPSLALALKSGYPAPDLTGAARSQRAAGGSPADAATTLRASYPQLTATQLAIILKQTFASQLALPPAMAQTLKGGGYAMNDASAALGLVYPQFPLASLAAALRAAYQA